jgi:1,4-dihydroxy-2-naphthoate octaprenyltransferase
MSISGGEVVAVAPAASLKRNVLLLVRLGRPKYLLYSWVLYTLGVAAAAYMGHTPTLTAYVHGQLFVWCVHLMTHYCNEYFDLQADLANPAPTAWTGGSRVLVEGLLKPWVSLTASCVLLCTALVLILAMPQAAQYAALVAVPLGWFYTAPPFQFNYRGLGELTVTTGLNGCVPMIAYALATDEFSFFPFLLLLPAFLIQFVRMTIMNLQDYEGDILVGKRTLPVRLGPARVVHMHAVVQALAYLLVIPGVLWAGIPLWVGLGVMASAPVAYWHCARLYRGAYKDPRTANNVVFWASTHCSLVVVGVYVGLLVDGYLRGSFSHLGGVAELFMMPIVIYTFILTRQIRKNRPQAEAEPEVAEVQARAA